MTQSNSDPFKIFLKHLLKKKGYGAQSELARKVGIRQQYVNQLADLQNTRSGSENVRRRIADYFGFSYESFLDRGRFILNPELEVRSELQNKYQIDIRSIFLNLDQALHIVKLVARLESLNPEGLNEVEKYVKFLLADNGN